MGAGHHHHHGHHHDHHHGHDHSSDHGHPRTAGAAFCWILGELDRAAVSPMDPEALFEHLHHCASQLAERGTFNALISNGQWLFATATSRLHWLTRRAPFRCATLLDPPLQVDFSTLTTANDVVTILSTEPLTADEQWQPVLAGESLLFSQGALQQRLRHDVRPASMSAAAGPRSTKFSG